MAKSIMGAVEELDEQIAPPAEEPADTEFETTMLAVMEAEQEIVDETTELTEMDGVLTEAEGAVERLEGLMAAIKTHGISKPMMKAFDPHGELSAAGIVPAVEELEEVPVKDENAEIAVEGIGQTINNIWTKLVEFFKKIAAKIVSWFQAMMRGFKSYEAALMAAIKKMSDANIDETKFKDVQVKTFAKADFDKVVAEVNKLISIAGSDSILKAAAELAAKLKSAGAKAEFKKTDVDAALAKSAAAVKGLANDAAMKEVLGVEVVMAKEGDEVEKIDRKKPSVDRKKASLTELGWKTADIDKALKSALAVVKATKAVEKTVAEVAKQYNVNAAMLQDQMKYVEGLDNEEIRTRNAAVTATKNITAHCKTLAGAATVNAQRVAASALSLAKAALSAKSK